ncbi:MAG: hypothetical protein AAFY13_04715 [Pseudomonadota bacterium]
MKDRAPEPIVRAIVNRPFLLTLTVCVGLFTLAYTGVRPDADTQSALVRTTIGIFFITAYALGAQMVQRLWLIAVVGAATLWAGLYFMGSAPAAGIAPTIPILILGGIGIGLSGLGALYCRRFGITILLAPGFFALAAFASAGLQPMILLCYGIGACLTIIISILLTHAYDQAQRQGLGPAKAAAEGIKQTASYAFFALFFAVGVGGFSLAGMDDVLSTTIVPEGFEPFRFFISIGLFSLPPIFLLPGLLWITHRFDRQLHKRASGRFDAIIPALWARARNFYALQTSYGLVAIAGVLLIVSIFVGTATTIVTVLGVGVFLSVLVGLAFFSLRVFIVTMTLLSLGAGLSTGVASIFGNIPILGFDLVAGLFLLALILAIPAQQFMQVSGDSKYRRTVMATFVQRTVGPFLTATGFVLTILTMMSLTQIWPSAVSVGHWILISLGLSLFLCPAVMGILSSRYGKY